MLRTPCSAVLLSALAATIFGVGGGMVAANGPAAVSQEMEQTLMAEGLAFERDHEWQKAIQHYERALRKNPDLSQVEFRLQIARIHHDVARRYVDGSFLSAVDEIDTNTALDLYSEVIAKLELNYVEPIDLTALIRHGTAFLEVAMVEKDFLARHLSTASPESIEKFRTNVHKVALAQPIRNRADARAMVSKIANLAQQQLGLKPSATIHEYVAGAVGLLDAYSGYMTSGELNEVMSQIKGNLIGLGVELSAEKDTLQIVEVFPRSPAAMAGLVAGDRILRVGDGVTSEISAQRAADMLKGPENSQVALLIERDGQQPREVLVTRRRVDVPSVPSAEIIDAAAGVAYLRLTNFQETTPKEVSDALMLLHHQGMKSLIIDLRRNPGGLLDAAVELADLFIKTGPIVSTRGRNGVENRTYAAHEPRTWQIPLTVMIDGDSASASEIFAGAIRDHRRGTLVGQTSYGKGSVQGLFSTDVTQGGLRLTVSKFFSPEGHPISSHGVKPHVAVELNPDGLSPGGKLVKVAKPRAGNDLPSNADSGSNEVAARPNLYSAAKPVLGSDGGSTIHFRSKDQDLVLRRALEVAKQSVVRNAPGIR